MSETETTGDVTTGTEEAAERLLNVGTEVKRKRGRPPGSKNKPKDGTEGTPKVNETNQRKIFAGALIALFSLLAIVLGWFGYEYHKKLTMESAEEGGTYLLPISQRIGVIATAAFYLSFPVWLLSNISQSFRKKVEAPAQANSAARGVSPNQPPPSYPVDAPINGVSPVADDSGFSEQETALPAAN